MYVFLQEYGFGNRGPYHERKRLREKNNDSRAGEEGREGA